MVRLVVSRGKSCGHVQICMWGGAPGHMSHVTDALQGHVDVGGGAGTYGTEEGGW